MIIHCQISSQVHVSTALETVSGHDGNIINKYQRHSYHEIDDFSVSTSNITKGYQ